MNTIKNTQEREIKLEDLHPKAWLSWSQLDLFEKDKKAYANRYILGEFPPPNKYMEFGKKFAEMLEKGKKPTDVRLLNALNFMPDYPVREFKFGELCILKKKKSIRLYCIFDCLDPVNHKISEIKTGKSWTQKKADGHGQITFYAYAYYLKHKIIPHTELIWVATEETEDGDIQATGEVTIFQTKRTVKDLLAIHSRIEAAWNGISELYSLEVNSIM